MLLRLDKTSKPFSIKPTLESGQLFRWLQNRGWWYGVVENLALRVRDHPEGLEVEASDGSCDEKFISKYFRLDDDLHRIFSLIARDDLVRGAFNCFRGLRLVRQDPWECLVSYVCATNSNIPAIKMMISNLCVKFGKKIRFGSSTFYSFPEPNVLSKASEVDLKACRLGYRARFVRSVANQIALGQIDLETISKLDYEKARLALMGDLYGEKALLGVGPKVADCVLLFSMEKLESFPIDVWITRMILNKYTPLFDDAFVKKVLQRSSKGSSLGRGEYKVLSEGMRRYFGEYAGYANEYLYHFTRTSMEKRSE